MEDIMTEETTAETETTGADDYFSGHTELITDEGAPVGKETADPAAAPAEKAAPVASPTPAAHGTDKPQTEIPEGFEGRFFEKDDKGAVTFKAEDAAGFLFSDEKNETRFKYQPINTVAEDPAAVAAAGAPQEPAWKKEMAEQKKYADEMRDGLFMYEKHYMEAINAGKDPAWSAQYARQKTQERLQEHLEEVKYANEVKRREALEKEGLTKAERADLKVRAATNEALFYQDAGGKEAFDWLMFGGRGKDGKMKEGVASQEMWMLFKLSNPGIQNEKLTAKKLNEKMSDWWTELSADRERLAFAYQIAKAKLMMTPSFKNNLIAKIRATAQGQIKTNREGAVRRPMGLTPAAKTPRTEADKTMTAFFDPMASREGLASV